MSETESRLALLSTLEANWQQAKAWAIGSPTDAALEFQRAALLGGRPASFPFVRPTANEVTWFTVAASADDLRSAIEFIRAWLMPNYGREERVETMPPGGASGMKGQILAASPGGYFVWKTPIVYLESTVKRLAEMARLEAKKPPDTGRSAPSLFELRRQFRAALMTGERVEAEAAVDAIDKNGLDTAANVAFMRVSLWDRFGEHAYVEDWGAVRNIVLLRMPQAVRTALVRAFHAHYLAPKEEVGDIGGALAEFRSRVEPAIGAILDLCRPEDSPEAEKCLRYRDEDDTSDVASQVVDDKVEHEVVPIAVMAERALAAKVFAAPIVPDTEELFFLKRFGDHEEIPALEAMEVARQRGDLRSAQELAELLIRSRWDELSEEVRTRLAASVRSSLETRTNPGLAALYEAKVSRKAATRPPPQDWDGFFAACREREWEAASGFIESEGRPNVAGLGLSKTHAVAAGLEDLLTDPGLERESIARSIGLSALLEVVEDLRSDIRFPRSEQADVYLKLLELWTLSRAGSVQHQDGSVFLILADAILQVSGDSGGEVCRLLKSWWDDRPSEALLPLQLAGLSLLALYESTKADAGNLWIDAAQTVRTRNIELGPGERRAWAFLGGRLGFEKSVVESYLGTDQRAAEADPLSVADLKKIAIVSMRERQAQEAAKMVSARCKAEVVLVAEKDAGPAAKSARTADIILVVWSAISHALFRAFDGVRDRVVYVQGTGSESIVLALERAVMAQARM